MEIVSRKTDVLVPYARNARTHSKGQVAQIAASIREYGFTNPILIDDEDGIIAGHGRVQAAQMLVMDEVPCIVLSGLTKAQKRAYIIADNKIALNAGWDDEMLKAEMADILEMTDGIGFSEKELKELFGDDSDVGEEPEVPFTDSLEIENNYLVLKFNNKVDWLQALTVFDVGQRQSLSTRKDGVVTPGMKSIGLGRVLDGPTAISKILGGV